MYTYTYLHIHIYRFSSYIKFLVIKNLVLYTEIFILISSQKRLSIATVYSICFKLS